MSDNTTPKAEGFYKRMERLMDETSDLREKALDRVLELARAFDKAAAPDKKAIEDQIVEADKESRRLRDRYQELRELERNPPWIKLSEALLDAKYDQVEELTRDGTLIKMMNEERVPVLSQPAYAGDEKIVDLLLSRGADPNMPGPDNLTPLLMSVFKDNAGIFKKLVAAGADMTARTTVGDGVRDLARYNDANEVKKAIKSLATKAKNKPKASAPGR